MQDPRRGLHLARWFHERDRNEFEASQAKKERETKKRRDAALAAALAAKERVQETSEDSDLAVKGETALSSVAAFLKDKKEREKAGSRPDSVEEVQEPPTRRLVYDSADPEGKNLDRRLDDLEFDSWFESGNLRAAWRVENRKQADNAPKNHGRAPLNTPSWAQQEYDLLCNKDTHTNGHVQWFYFSVRRTNSSPRIPEKLRVRLNIVNMMKKSSLYDVGMLPVRSRRPSRHRRDSRPSDEVVARRSGSARSLMVPDGAGRASVPTSRISRTAGPTLDGKHLLALTIELR